ncbi:MAG TPA: hypothetical protein VJ992_01135 [Gemmatimonadales bacterium]|nr:hypothetical protein [Gemmatimonadales bacterium]
MFGRHSLPASLALLAVLAAPVSAQQDSTPPPPPPAAGAMRPMAGPPMGGMMHMRGQGQMRGFAMQRMRGMRPMMRGMMQGAMRVRIYSPKSLLDHKDALGLTQAQVDRLSQLDSDATKAMDQARADQQSHLKALRDALDAAKPDSKTVKAEFDAAHQAMGAMQWAAINAALGAKAVLTPVQSARVQGWADAMQHRMMGAGARGGMGGPMRHAPGTGWQRGTPPSGGR